MDWNRSGEGQGGPGMLTSRRWHLPRWEKFGGGVGGRTDVAGGRVSSSALKLGALVAQAPSGAGKHEPV